MTRFPEKFPQLLGAGQRAVPADGDQGVDVELYLDENRPSIKSGGTVVWVVKKSSSKKGTYLYDTGIEFIDIRPEDREKISERVEEILKSQRRK